MGSLAKQMDVEMDTSIGIGDDTEDVSLNFGDEHDPASQKNIKHPIAVFFHLFFRILSMVTYLLCGWFSDSFIANFVFIVMFLSMDFWTVKNITGRLLVGLRWWNYVDEDGKSHWVFESRKGAAKNLVATAESQIFWLSIVLAQVFWIVIFFGTLFTFKFKWFMVVCVALALNGANLFGYVRCKTGSSKKSMSSVATNFLGQQVFKSMISSTLASNSQASGSS